MKKFLVGMIGVALISGCSTTNIDSVSYPIQTRENVQNKQQTKDVSLSKEGSSVIESEAEPESVDAPILEQEVVQENVQQPKLDSPLQDTITESPVVSEDLSTELTLTSFVDDLSQCKIKDTSGEWYSKGFPIRGNAVPYQGTINIAVVPIDFDNAVGPANPPLSDFRDMLKKTEEWATFVSGGKMEYKVHMHNSWIRAPKGAEWYRCAQCPHSGPELQSRAESYNQLISASAAYYDYNQIDFIYFLVPEAAVIEHGTQIYGRVGEIPTFAFYSSPSEIWDHVIHELVHDQGFIGHGPANGSDFGVMMSNGASKAMLSWESFQAGWFDDEDIVCIDARDGFEPVTVQINSLDKLGASGAAKSVIIRLDNTTAYVIEYRTAGPFSTLPSSLHGITVYYLDVSKPSHRCDGCGPQQIQDAKNWWQYIRPEGTFDGRKNNNVVFKNFGNILSTDRVSISLAENSIRNIVSISE